MKARPTFIDDTLHDFSELLKSSDFSRAVLLAIALTLPILFGIRFNMVQTGIVITVGTMLASPSDVSGSIYHKITGILLSALIAMIMSLIGGYLKFSFWVMFPVIGIIVFGISYISIYGFRASLISFSGLFALVLSFSPVSGEMPTYERALLIGVGGLWYALMALIWHYVFPKGPTEFYLSKTMSLTADYLRIRGKLVEQKGKRKELMKELLHIQTELTETHETLRNILISRRAGSGKSVYEGKRLLIFSILIDMLELAMTNPVNYAKTDALFEKKPHQLIDFQNLLFEMANRLDEISNHISNPKKLTADSKLKECLLKVEKDLNELSKDPSGDFDEDILMIRNLYKYQTEQARKIEKIEWLYKESDRQQIRFIKDEEARKFLTKQSYDLDILIENFNFDSTIFRHSLRMAVITIIGYAIGIMFEVQNSYWILLTIIVIMRPNFGLTKKRSQERTVGTLIGGVLAVLVVILVKNPVVYGILAILTLIISFTMVQRNYKAAATFITLSVVFIYALLTPDVFDVIQYRVTDTVIGTSLAIFGNLFLWPAWEIQSMHKTLLDTTCANRAYFKEIVEYYKDQGEASAQYRVARKKAFLEMSNLSSAFQRMTQEPRSRQKNLDKFYEIVELNHTFLSSLASLSTYIMNNPTTPATENFKRVTSRIDDNLKEAVAILRHSNSSEESEPVEMEDIFEITYGQSQLMSQGQNISHSEIEEAHLVREQLKWLLAMSEKMPKLLLEIPVE